MVSLVHQPTIHTSIYLSSQPASQLIGRWVGLSVSPSVGQSVGRSVSQPVSQSLDNLPVTELGKRPIVMNEVIGIVIEGVFPLSSSNESQ